MAIPIADLLKRVPPETEALVEKTKQRYNQAIRQILRAETRLHLTCTSARDLRGERDLRSVRVFLKPGTPEQLKCFQFEDSSWIAIELAPLRGSLELAQLTLRDLDLPIWQLNRNADFATRFPGSIFEIWGMQVLVDRLLEEAQRFDFLKKVFGINEDVLGMYSFRERKSSQLDIEPSPIVQIELYWGVIGLVSRVLGVSVEALTIKVLAHELAHAYTHIGNDADGKHWSTNSFRAADIEVKEGLAQYYTLRVLDRLSRQTSEARLAYERLLPHQPPCYRAHQSWVEGYTPEEVREAMITIRRNGTATTSCFEEALFVARKRLRNT